jgi:phosphatidylserine decarboxylase
VSNKNHNVFYTQDGNLICEKVEAEGLLTFLYTNRIGKILRSFVNKQWFAKLCGLYQDSFLSKNKIVPFIKKHNIDTDEFEKSVDEFSSFNDFFIRELKAEARLINDNPRVVVSPADSKLFVIENISQSVSFFIKHRKFNVYSFLKDSTLARYYEGGVMMIFRLAPYDYHRFHFPIDCVANKPIVINGIFESVNPIVYRSGHQPLIENERHIIMLQSQAYGDVAFVPVGAMCVGKIVETFISDKYYKKGDECGYFAFGGSTIVLLFKKGMIKPKEIFVKHSKEGYETQVRMGQAVTE